LDRRASIEEPEGLSHRDAVLPDLLRDLLVGQAKLLGESLEAARLFDRVEVCALQVLDEA